MAPRRQGLDEGLRNWLLDVMLNDGTISKDAAEAAAEAPLGIVVAK